MKTTKVIVSFALLLMYSTTQAQLGRLIEKAAQKTIERKVEQKIEQKVEQSVNTAVASKINVTAAAFTAATPEEIIKQCPTLPSVKQLVDGSNTYASGPEIEAFQEKIEMLRENTKRILEATEAQVSAVNQQDGDRIAQQFTGHSLAELENMNEVEQEAMINKQLASMGLGNLTIAQLQSMEDKSDEEIMAAMSKNGVTIGGLTMEEIKAMENMTDAQKKAYMQKGDRKQRAQAFADSQETKEMLKKGENAAVIMQTNTELQSINVRWREFYQQVYNEDQEMERQIAAIDAKYAPKVAAIKPTKWVVSGEMGNGYEFSDAEQKAREKLFTACRTEQYTLWRNYVIKKQERIKTIMTTDVPRYDELMKEYLTAAGMISTAPLTPSAGYSFAITYLDAAGDVTTLPGIEISGILGEGN